MRKSKHAVRRIVRPLIAARRLAKAAAPKRAVRPAVRKRE